MRPSLLFVVVLAAACGKAASHAPDGGNGGGGLDGGGGDLGSSCGDCTLLPNVDPTKVACVAGACRIAGACLPNFADCNGALADGCEADLSHPDHCGACGTSCMPAAPLCSNADGNYSCVASCAGTAGSECGMSCVDEKSDPQHCGSCLACPTAMHGVAVCASSTCAIQCDPGYDLYNGQCTRHVAGSWGLESFAPYAPRLNAVWGSSANDVYVVGEQLIAHSSGDGRWAIQDTSPQLTASLRGVWGSGPSDIYAVGGHVILHSTGNGVWTSQTSGETKPTFTAVWGSGAGDVYAVGPSTIWHSTGNGTWTAETAPISDIETAWGSGPHDVYLAGGDLIFHSTGDGNWTMQNFPSTLLDLCGNGKGNVYAVGYGVLHTTGDQSWAQEMTPAELQPPFEACWVAPSGVVYAALTGSQPIVVSTGHGDWTRLLLSSGPDTQPDYVAAIWGASDKEVYAVGNGSYGQILHLH